MTPLWVCFRGNPSPFVVVEGFMSALEIKTRWGDTILDSIHVADQSSCCVELVRISAEHAQADTYVIDIPERCTGHLLRGNKTIKLADALRGDTRYTLEHS